MSDIIAIAAMMAWFALGYWAGSQKVKSVIKLNVPPDAKVELSFSTKV